MAAFVPSQPTDFSQSQHPVSHLRRRGGQRTKLPRIESVPSFVASRVVEGFFRNFFPNTSSVAACSSLHVSWRTPSPGLIHIDSLPSSFSSSREGESPVPVSSSPAPRPSRSVARREERAILVEKLLQAGVPAKQETLLSVVKRIHRYKKIFKSVPSYPALFRVNTRVRHFYLEVHSYRDILIVILDPENPSAWIQSGVFKGVYRAWHIRTQTMVAYAVSDLMNSPRLFQQATANEETFLHQLNGQTGTTEVLKTVYYGISRQVILMRYYSDTLLSVIKKGLVDHYTDEQKLLLSLNLANTVAYMHGKNIAHRDLKPENILIHLQNEKIFPSSEKDIVVTDFGCACSLLNEWIQQGITGSHAYISYERILLHRDGIPLESWPPLTRQETEAQDVWAFALILWVIFIEDHCFPWFGDLQKNSAFGWASACQRLEKLRKLKCLAKSKIGGLMKEMLTLDPKKRMSMEDVFDRLNEIYQNEKARERER